MALGLAINRFRAPPLPLAYVSKEQRIGRAVSQITSRQTNATAAASQPVQSPAGDSPRIIDLPAFREFAQTQGLVLDARPEIFYRLGHVPGALNLPREDFEHGYDAHRSALENRDQSIAVYCSDADCEDSRMVADALAKLGYRRILVFPGGWADWTQAGLPEERQ
jgi:rhodanese-related sulfurtransferase